MDFGSNPYLGRVIDKTDADKQRLMNAILDTIGTQQLRQFGLNDPDQAASLPVRDRRNLAEGRKSYMQALFDKAVRMYGQTPLHDPRRGPGAFGRHAVEAQMLPGVSPEQHGNQIGGILRAAYPEAFKAGHMMMHKKLKRKN
jgi:hypothetical protein